MSRWGEEEKKGKGLFGCAIAFSVLSVAIYVFVINYQNLEQRRILEAYMQDVIHAGISKTEAQMIGEILDKAEEMGLDQVNADTVSLTKGLDDYGNPLVDVEIQFTFEVDLVIHKFEVSIPIGEEVAIVSF